MLEPSPSVLHKPLPSATTSQGSEEQTTATSENAAAAVRVLRKQILLMVSVTPALESYVCTSRGVLVLNVYTYIYTKVQIPDCMYAYEYLVRVYPQGYDLHAAAAVLAVGCRLPYEY